MTLRSPPAALVSIAAAAIALAGCASATEGAGGDGVTYSDSSGGGWQTLSGADSGADAVAADTSGPGTPDAAASTDGAGPRPDPTGGVPCATPDSVGCGCVDGGDCGVGLTCLGSICVGPCPEDCLDGWVCIPSLGLCVPPHAMLCAPCVEDADCLTPDASCVSLGAGGAYCGTPCSQSGCPEGFTCKAIGAGAGAPERCMPPGEACGCSGLAKGVGAATTCFVEVGGTECAGTRECGPDGLSPCEATGAGGPECGDGDPDPVCTDEVCNGVDDDCDGATDEDLTQSCTTGCGSGTEICLQGAWAGCSAPAPVCDPATPCCGADGCSLLVHGTICGDDPASETTTCDGACGGAILLEETWPTCSGSSGTCGDGAPQVTTKVQKECAPQTLCIDGQGVAGCTDCDFGCADGACVEVQEDPRVICIDPGYGGPDPGPGGNGTTGATVTWSLAGHLIAWLEADTFDPGGGGAWAVVLTRSQDEDPEWAERSAVCNDAGAERVLAIYSNAYNGVADGSETYYMSSADGADGESFATLVQSELIEHGGLDDRGTQDSTWAILSGTDAPGAMTFVGFLDNPGDGGMMAQDSWRQEVAKGFMHALQQAFGAQPYTP